MFNVDLLVVYAMIANNPVLIPVAVGVIIIPILILIFIFKILFYAWLNSRGAKFAKTIEFSILAIDIPKNNEQNLVAVEQLYVSLTAIKSSPNFIDATWYGKFPLSISLELISIDGYIQFIIRTPKRYQDLVESAVYAQYPEAEISLVEDYVSLIPDNITEPECQFQIWGTEFILSKPSAFPLRTYKVFEHMLSDSFNDPLTALLEAYSRMGKGEHAALQIIITPSDAWKTSAKEEINKVIGNKTKQIRFDDKLAAYLIGIIDKVGHGVLGIFGVGKIEGIKKEEKVKTFGELLPAEKNLIEDMQKKLTQPSFSITMRYYYLAKKEVFSRNRGVDAIKGAMSQFGRGDGNSFSMHANTRTDAEYFFVEERVRSKTIKIIENYKGRSRAGATEFYLSTEELATIYHFPSMNVKTPLLPKTMIKKVQPPSILPIIDDVSLISSKVVSDSNPTTDENYISQVKAKFDKDEIYKIVNSLPGYDFDNKYYEDRYQIKSAEQVKSEFVEKHNQSEGLNKKLKYEVPDNLPIISE